MKVLKTVLTVLLGVPAVVIISLLVGAGALLMINIVNPIAGVFWLLGWSVWDANPSGALLCWVWAYAMDVVLVTYLMLNSGINPALALVFPLSVPLSAVNGLWDVIDDGPRKRFLRQPTTQNMAGSPAMIRQETKRLRAAGIG